MSNVQTTSGLRERILAFDRAMTADEVATLFVVTPQTIYQNAKKGIIPSFRIGTSVRFDPKAVVEWFEKQ